MFYSTPAGYSQSSGCYFTAMNLYGPPSVQEGQKLEVHILFSVTCTGLGDYTIRADLVDGRTGQILSSNRTTYAILGPFAAVLTNQVLAPMTVGWWSLQLNLYMLDSNGVPVATAISASFRSHDHIKHRRHQSSRSDRVTIQAHSISLSFPV